MKRMVAAAPAPSASAATRRDGSKHITQNEDDSGGAAVTRRKHHHQDSPAKDLHDKVNLYLLPWLSLHAAIGCALPGSGASILLTYVLLAYIGVDLVWILLVPDAVPQAWLIQLHHVITIALLSHPLRYPEHAHFTAWDGIVEAHTLLLIARRRLRQWPLLTSPIVTLVYWVSFIGMRLVLYPALVYVFYLAMCKPTPSGGTYPFWETTLVVGSQALLCVFNVGFLYLSLRRKKFLYTYEADTGWLAKVYKEYKETLHESLSQENLSSLLKKRFA